MPGLFVQAAGIGAASGSKAGHAGQFTPGRTTAVVKGDRTKKNPGALVRLTRPRLPGRCAAGIPRGAPPRTLAGYAPARRFRLAFSHLTGRFNTWNDWTTSFLVYAEDSDTRPAFARGGPRLPRGVNESIHIRILDSREVDPDLRRSPRVAKSLHVERERYCVGQLLGGRPIWPHRRLPPQQRLGSGAPASGTPTRNHRSPLVVDTRGRIPGVARPRPTSHPEGRTATQKPWRLNHPVQIRLPQARRSRGVTKGSTIDRTSET